MFGETIRDTFDAVLITDPAVADQQMLERLAVRSNELRSWLDALDVRIARRAKILTGASPPRPIHPTNGDQPPPDPSGSGETAGGPPPSDDGPSSGDLVRATSGDPGRATSGDPDWHDADTSLPGRSCQGRCRPGHVGAERVRLWG